MCSRLFNRSQHLAFAVFAALGVFVAGCNGDNLVIGPTVTPTATATNTPTPTPTATPVDRTSFAAYADPGPYPVGFTTLSLSDRLVAPATTRSPTPAP